MNPTVRFCQIEPAAAPGDNPFDLAAAQAARRFHQSIPEYAPTPLVSLDGLAARLGIEKLYVKDESRRFGLNAFKALGGSWAIARQIARMAGLDPDSVTFEQLRSPQVRARTGTLTFVTATDGNHGRGVAWTAARLGHKSVVYMPKGSAKERLTNIRALGSEAFETDENYDGAVRLAHRRAGENGWILVQDTAWEGYETVPLDVMRGYTTLALEAAEQLANRRPTHVFLQAGVGSMAGAVASFLTGLYADAPPHVVLVEPTLADCVFRTAQALDGTLHSVSGDMPTMMAGLACGEVCPIAWRMLRHCARSFAAVDDSVAAHGMRLLGLPQDGDARIVSGESGAVTTGFLALVLTDPRLEEIRRRIGLDARSRVLCVSTEGDTDRENYRRIVGI